MTIPPPHSNRNSSDDNTGQPGTAEQSLASAAHNWYAKLHPIGAPAEALSGANNGANGKPKSITSQPLNLSIFFRIWLAVAVIIIVSSVVAFTQLFEYVKPTTQQVIEDTLVDTSKLLAVSLSRPMQSGLLYNDDYQQVLDQAFIGRKPSKANSLKSIPDQQRSANTPTPWYHLKTHSSFRVYVTDPQGTVIYDSRQGANNAEGQDYSRWNDVYLTLRGDYGARSTAQRPGDSTSAVMYVAQPIESEDGSLIGVVSVGKPVATIVPYLEATRSRMLTALLVISALALMMAGLVAWWLKQSMALVARYTRSLAQQTDKPYFYLGRELNELSDTIEGMKDRLENRAYVTDYVHTLTHELKSPLTAIRASGELLEDPCLEEEDRLMLSQTITEQSIKLQSLIDRLLLLATVEQPTFKLQKERLDLPELLQSLLTLAQAKLQQRQLSEIPLWINEQPIDKTTLAKSAALTQGLTIFADKFWLSQALQNVLDNAIYFAQSQVIINLRPHSTSLQIDIFNDGAPIAEYALAKVFDRYFSLSHQAIFSTDPSQPRMQAKKGTGLGLTLVKQVIEHHGGQVIIRNISKDIIPPLASAQESQDPTSIQQPTNGVLVTIELPLALPISSE